MFLSFCFLLFPSLLSLSFPLHFAHSFQFSCASLFLHLLVSKAGSERTRDRASHTYVQFRTVHFISKVNSVEIKSNGYGIETPGNRVGWIDTSSIGAVTIYSPGPVDKSF